MTVPAARALRRALAALAALALAALALAACAAASGPAPAPPAADRAPSPPAAPPLSPQARANLASFDQVWQTVKDKHWDRAQVGPSWDQARRELRPRVAAARSIDEARAVMTELLGRLGLSHFGVIPAAAAATSARPCSPGDLGLDARVIDEGAVVTGVAPGGPAAAAGVRPGWLIDQIDDTEIAPLVAKVRQSLPAQRAAPIEAVLRLSSGCAGERARVRARGRGDRPVTVEIARAEPAGREVAFGNLPALRLSYRARRLPRSAAYVSLSLFIDAQTVLADFARDMDRFASTRGLVLDLRGNPGGIAGMAMGIGSWFVRDHIHKLGTMKTRDAVFNLILTPRPRPYAGKLAILVDELSMSTSEMLAGGLQDIGRARVFGTRTPGAALPSAIERLPNGDGFQYALGSYVSVGGKSLEGSGVVPDEEVPLTRAALLAGRDPALEAAQAWIRANDKE
jgi:carboxyl-terminal processing protease